MNPDHTEAILSYPDRTESDVDPLRAGAAVLVWAIALAALCSTPAAVIAAWRWFL